MENAKISIIVPVYNKEQYIEKCVRSISAQTYTDFELILVDDGSSDSSLSICEKLAKEDDRIRVIARENGGVSAARNTGISAAGGKYIGFVDADDYIEPEMFEKLVLPFFSNGSIDMTACGFSFTYVNESNTSEKAAEHDFTCSRQDALIMLFDRKNNHHFKGYNVNKLYKTAIIRKNSLSFDCRVKYGEDIKFNFDYMQYIRLCYVVAFCGYHYYLNENSATYTTIASLENEEEDLVSYYISRTDNEEIRKTILKWAIIYYRSLMYECYNNRIPKRIKKYVSRFFRRNEAFYLKDSCIDSKERLFALSVGRAEPFYHLTQKLKRKCK